jgi:hypothetical protein
MQSFLAKVAALALVAGGFAVTGDLGRLVDRGRRVIEGRGRAATAPAEAPPQVAAGAAEPPRTAAPAAAVDPGPLAPLLPAEPLAARPRDPAADAPVGRRVAVPPPPTTGPAAVDPRQLAAGARVLVWVRQAGRPANAAHDLVALDIVDPGSAEALLHRHAALALDGRTRVEAAPRRVVIGTAGASRIARGEPLRLTPLHGVNGPGQPETLGSVAAIEIAGGTPPAP